MKTEYVEEPFDVITNEFKAKLKEILVSLTGRNGSVCRINFYEELRNKLVNTSSYEIAVDGNLQVITRKFNEKGKLVNDEHEKGKAACCNLIEDIASYFAGSKQIRKEILYTREPIDGEDRNIVEYTMYVLEKIEEGLKVKPDSAFKNFLIGVPEYDSPITPEIARILEAFKEISFQK